jgi:hypothetical protein
MSQGMNLKKTYPSPIQHRSPARFDIEPDSGIRKAGPVEEGARIPQGKGILQPGADGAPEKTIRADPPNGPAPTAGHAGHPL